MEQLFHKKCAICNEPFTARVKKALYCGRIACKKTSARNRKKQKESITFLYQVQLTLLHRKVDFIIGVLAMQYKFKIPHDMMPKEHQLDIEEMGGNLVRLFGRKKNKLQKEVNMVNEKIESLKPFAVEKAPEPKTKKVNSDNLIEPVKKEIIGIIKDNTGKYPILPPQANKIIKEIIESITKKNKEVNTVSGIIREIISKYPELKTLPNAKDF